MNLVKVSAKIAAVAAALLIANGAGAAAIKAAQYDLAITRYSDEAGLTIQGAGFLRYDRGAIDQQLGDWMAQWDVCFASGGDACEGLDAKLDVQFPVIDASFEMFGHTFVDDEIVWVERFGYGDQYQGHLESLSLTVEFGAQSVDPYIYFAAGDDTVNLSYNIAGNHASCSEGFCSAYDAEGNFDEDFRSFEWTDVPVPTPEPATSALMLLGLVALAIPRKLRLMGHGRSAV